MTEEIIDLMKSRQQTIPVYGTEYRILQKIRNTFRQLKAKWFNERFAKIERINITDKSGINKRLRSSSRKPTLIQRILKIKERILLIDKEN